MRILTLLRHGQASFDGPDYDVLSPTGEEQSRRLGEFWAERGIIFSKVFVGPRKRHQQTWERLAEPFTLRGIRLPEPIVLPGLDEFAWEPLLKRELPRAAAEDDTLAQHLEHYLKARNGSQKGPAFQKLFSHLVRKWIYGEIRADDIETWSDFCARVEAALDTIREACERSPHVLAVTSGGPIAVSLRRALGLTDDHTLEIMWTHKNGAYTELVPTHNGWSLAGFNHAAHLTTPKLITYR
jgi:broad specificity phosphatase PhoE